MATADLDYLQLLDDISRCKPLVHDDLSRHNALGRLAQVRRAIDAYQRAHPSLKGEKARFFRRAIVELDKFRRDLEGRTYTQTHSTRKAYRGINRARRLGG